ncbi:putative baseplate assembly protein [Bacillus pseudomycoides]|uniref:putative baseplate assembly protein n=1 Tax=Bacillus pseudomycoides TaxID=64104 RepID=UPI0014832E51|nr:putative baseplate assembly protein [Bacillus pseudomycoides]MBD5799845.1 putative baseplate assembly protein [Bacillus pseudomycoides]MED1476533.1 putative baseplate assembly protein [Bacillus pseudomycoides]
MSAPKIDKRDMEALLKQIREMVPFYTPEWKASDESDSGVALLRIFSQMVAGVIGRLNQVPDKNFIAFLNMLGLKLLPAMQARALVTFNLSTGTDEPVLIPESTQVTALPSDGGEPIVFRTEKNMMATPAKLVQVFSSDKAEDGIFQAPSGLFEGTNFSPFSSALLDVGNEGKSIVLAETAGLKTGDILKIGEECSEIDQVSDTKITLRDKLRSVHNAGDSVEKVTLFELFAGPNRQEHVLYLGHEAIFNVKDEVRIQLNISGSMQSLTKLADPSIFTWQFWNEDWEDLGFESLSSIGEDQIKLVLVKQDLNRELKENKEIKEHEVNDVKSRWIRCVSRNIKKSESIEINTIRIAVTPLNAEVEADLAFYNDVPLNPAEFYPFGKQPRQFDSFYLACQEAFSKKGSFISITFDLSHDVPIRETSYPEITAELSWEYWNGTGWIKLHLIKDCEHTDKEVSENLAKSEPKCLIFKCPEEIAQVTVNGQLNFWIRSRIVSGDYGREEIIQTCKNTFELKPKFCPPKMTKLQIKYGTCDEVFYLDKCLTLNNLEYRDRSKECRTGNRFKPFYSVNHDNQALYLGFDRPPLKGPISIFLSLEEQEYMETQMPQMEWEYFREQNGKREWARLEVLDRTNSLTQSGTIEFMGPLDFYQSSFFGKSLYWIRAINTKRNLIPFEKRLKKFIVESRRVDHSKKMSLHPSCTRKFSHLLEPFHPLFSVPPEDRVKPPAPKIKGIFMNTTMVTQAESIREEILGSSDGEGGQSFILSRVPVIDEEIYVNEVDSLSERERKDLVKQKRLTIHEVKDEKGRVTEFWVKWIPVDDLKESTAVDRHYEIDRTFGRIQFGDGINGVVPPMGKDNMKANFQAGGGALGNVGPQEITTLQSSIAYVDSVSNPEAAEGGCNTESLEQALRRGPQMLKHRDRAVTLQDFESLAVVASRNIAKVKCLPHTNDSGQSKTGWVTVLIVPQSNDKQPKPSVKLKHQVGDYLRGRVSNVVIPKRFLITGPAYTEVSIHTDLMASSLNMVPIVENRAMKKIKDFLHPLSGGHDGLGWEFGRIPCLSDFFALLQGIEGVDCVGKLTMTISSTDGSQRMEVSPNNPVDVTLPPYALISSGTHHVKVKG